MRIPAAATILAAALAACDSGEDAPAAEGPPACAATTTVSIFGVGFVPPCVRVPAGATVRFQNADTESHTVTATTGESFDSRILAPGQSFEHAFPSAGTVLVHCSLHPSTIGSVVVE